MITRRIVILLLGFGLSGLAWPAGSAGPGWPQFRGPQRDGRSSETGLLAVWPEGGPRELWRVPLGEGYSGIAAVSGRLYTQLARGNDELAVCLDADDGREIWSFRTDKKWIDRFGNGPRSTPTVDGDLVFVLSGRGKLYALSAASGEQRWSRDLAEEYGAEPPQWGVSTSPLVEGRLLLVDVGGSEGRSVVAFDRSSGKEVWHSQADRAGYSAPIVFTVSGVRQALFFTAGKLVSLRPADGTLLWEIPWKTSYDVNAATPIFIAPDRVFVSSGYDKGSALLRLKTDSGAVAVEEIWRTREMKNRFSSSVLHDGHLYGFDEKTFKCLEVASAETKWRQRDLGHGSLMWADDRLIVLGDKGQLVLVDATPEQYRERGRLRVFSGKTWTVPTLLDGKLYVRDEKELVSLQLAADGD